MQALPEGVTNAAELRAHYKRTRDKFLPRPVLIVDNTPEPQPVPVTIAQPISVYYDPPKIVYLNAASVGLDHLPKIGEIIHAVCVFYNVSRIDMISQRRTAGLVRHRQIAMYLARKLTTRSLPEIGYQFGGRDHTTVLHGFRKIERLMKTDDRLKDEIDVLKLRIGDAVLNRRVF